MYQKMNRDMYMISVSDYTIVAEARGQKVLYYRMFGSYQGEWILFSSNKLNYYIYKGCYGSCSGCDSLQAELGGEYESYNDESIQNFIKDYEAFLIIPKKLALKFSKKNELSALFPLNIRDEYSDIQMGDVIKQCELIIKADFNVITPYEILELDNMETRRGAIEKIGVDNFAVELNAEILDSNGVNKLATVKLAGKEDMTFLILQDSSTPRKYFLRVPPEISTINKGLCWSFGIDEYKPILET
jgi:hypothetical protein